MGKSNEKTANFFKNFANICQFWLKISITIFFLTTNQGIFLHKQTSGINAGRETVHCEGAEPTEASLIINVLVEASRLCFNYGLYTPKTHLPVQTSARG